MPLVCVPLENAKLSLHSQFGTTGNRGKKEDHWTACDKGLVSSEGRCLQSDLVPITKFTMHVTSNSSEVCGNLEMQRKRKIGALEQRAKLTTVADWSPAKWRETKISSRSERGVSYWQIDVLPKSRKYTKKLPGAARWGCEGINQVQYVSSYDR